VDDLLEVQPSPPKQPPKLLQDNGPPQTDLQKLIKEQGLHDLNFKDEEYDEEYDEEEEQVPLQQPNVPAS